ncbi:hypothetical protein RCO28_22335 [Streptomyces sp. LHD-70]|uniref:hypothetical protein n=1 Tax=Streptomyces sp. LHD-70 TaxID=3072140 RepID=UPI00280E637B|nr:hypothetical protein [Streptomyces sp. LHD-70]MDQ8705214.1 hypothetical protein [Streptomyces sp. LHD-70]
MDNQHRPVDVIEILQGASLLVPEAQAGADDLTVSDVWEHLSDDAWDVAVALLEELGGAPPLPPSFWQELATAAGQLHLPRSAAWCRWRADEAVHGIVRADLTLAPEGESRRRTPLPGAGVLRPMWRIGHRTPQGEPVLDIAALWVESVPFLEPGGRATVRLAPLVPPRWRHLRPGQVITLHEDNSTAGTAVVLDVRPPQEPAAT